MFSPPRPCFLFLWLRNQRACLAILLALMLGCGGQESISRYSVPKEENTPVAPARATSDREQTESPQAWFFKMLGAAEAVTAAETQFTALMESLDFSSGEPTWTLPEGWSAEPGSQMRFATLKVDDTEPPLEVTVIKLPVFGDSRSEYVRQNIDRWRGQLGLEPMEGNDWVTAAKERGEVSALSANSQQVTLVDLSGKTDKFDEARMLGAVILPDMPAPAESSTPLPETASTPQPEPSSSAITFETPEGWDTGKASSMRAASFAVTDGEQSVDISAMMAGGDELANVNRWRGQIGLEDVTQETLDETARELDVDGQTARLFNLIGEEQTIVAVIVPQGGQSWFFKMMGDPALAERELANFEAFVTSVKFPE